MGGHLFLAAAPLLPALRPRPTLRCAATTNHYARAPLRAAMAVSNALRRSSIFSTATVLSFVLLWRYSLRSTFFGPVPRLSFAHRWHYSMHIAGAIFGTARSRVLEQEEEHQHSEVKSGDAARKKAPAMCKE